MTSIDLARAKFVRDALRAIACEPDNVRSLPHHDREMAWGLASAGADETMVLLWKLMR